MVENVEGVVIKKHKGRPSVIVVDGFFYTLDFSKGQQRTKKVIQKDIEFLTLKYPLVKEQLQPTQASNLKKQLKLLQQELEENTR
jgi:hypothetical protein